MTAMTIRLTPAQHERLRREAFDQRVSMQSIVTDALAARFAGWDQDDSGPWPVTRIARRNAEGSDGSGFERTCKCGRVLRSVTALAEHRCPFKREPTVDELVDRWLGPAGQASADVRPGGDS